MDIDKIDARDRTLILDVIKKYKRALRLLFRKYSFSNQLPRANAAKSSFEQNAERKDCIAVNDIVLIMRDYEIFPNFITKD